MAAGGEGRVEFVDHGVTNSTRRVRLRVSGTVQGVGFRPFVYRLAGELGLGGWVLNDSRGVLVEVEGEGEAVAEFLRRLPDEAPPLAAVERVEPEEVPPRGEAGFEIVASDAGGEAAAPVSPDSATCADCLAELFDPGDRRHRYPFVNCTNCGPRFTIVAGVPYDRSRTTMAGFEMCAACLAEYEDPGDRRFHAEPNACPACGPQARLVDPAGTDLTPDPAGVAELSRDMSRKALPPVPDAVGVAAAMLRGGAILAVKGLGGYHLACLAGGRGGGGGAALAQAPRGEAVRAPRSGPRRGPRPGRARRGGGSAADLAGAADRARAPARGSAGRPLGRARARASSG